MSDQHNVCGTALDTAQCPVGQQAKTPTTVSGACLPPSPAVPCRQ